MSNLTNLLFHPLSNAIMTMLTGITTLYWIITFIAGDLFGDSGVDGDIDAHGADVDTDLAGDDHGSDQPFVAFLVTRYATKPLIKVYQAMGYNGEEPQELLGRIARMRSTISGDTIGAAELKIQNDIIRINVKSKTGESISYDAEVMIADESPDKKFYLVVREITLSNIV